VVSAFVEAKRKQNVDLDISSDEPDELPGPGQYDIQKHSVFNVEKNPNSFFGSLCD
jgi:hypothetical protein